MEINKKNQKGMSLVEILLYLAISTVIMTALSYFMITTTKSRVKSQTITEVHYQGNNIIEIISNSIRGGIGITTPTSNTSCDNLSIITSDTNTNPILIYLSEQKVYFKQGTDDPIQMSSNRVDILSLSFSNVSSIVTNPIIKTEISITHKNPENRIEYNFSEIFNSSDSIRK